MTELGAIRELGDRCEPGCIADLLTTLRSAVAALPGIAVTTWPGGENSHPSVAMIQSINYDLADVLEVCGCQCSDQDLSACAHLGDVEYTVNLVIPFPPPTSEYVVHLIDFERVRSFAKAALSSTKPEFSSK